MPSGDVKTAVWGTVSVLSVNLRKCEVCKLEQIFISVFNPLSLLKKKKMACEVTVLSVCPPLANVDQHD